MYLKPRRVGQGSGICCGWVARVEMGFDGKTLTLLRKDTNVYTQGNA